MSTKKKIYTYIGRYGNSIIERGVDENGNTYQTDELFEPYLFTNTSKESPFKGLDGKNLLKITFQNANEMKEYLEKFSNIDGHDVYGIRDVVSQYISDFHNESDLDVSKIYGNILDIEVFSGHWSEEKQDWIFGGFPNTDKADMPINAITFFDTKLQLYRVYGLEKLEGHFIGTFKNSHKDVIYNGFENEKSLLKSFLTDFANSEFHFVSGWYVELFDIVYLTNRILNVLSENDAKLLSPLRKIKKKTLRGAFGNDHETYRWLGMATLDYIDLNKKLDVGYKPKNWKLNTVAKDKIGDNKVPYEGPLQELYLKDYQSFIEYNIHDVRLIVKMDEKDKFFELIFTIAHMMKSNVEDAFATVKPWTNLMYHSLKEKNTFPKLKGVSGLDYEYVGGFVKTPRLGFNKWVVSWDVNSLYPHLMQQYNLGEETLIPYKELAPELKEIANHFHIDRDIYHNMQLVQEKMDKNVRDFIDKKLDLSPLKKYNYSLTGAGFFFSNEGESTFNSKTKEIYNLRVESRKKLAELKKAKSTNITLMSQLQNKQMALKLMMNSLYGAVANSYFTEYFDIRVAEAITSSGQRAIQFVADRINKRLNKICKTENHDFILAIDTDSVVGDTLVYYNNKQIKIEDLYNKFNEYEYKDDFNKSYVKPSYGNTLSFNEKNKKIEEKNINYIMKHRVKKRMFRFSVDNKSIIVTEDHSIIILRNGKYISCKPNDIIAGDKLIKIV